MGGKAKVLTVCVCSVRGAHYGMHDRPVVRTLSRRGLLLPVFHKGGRRAQGEVGACRAQSEVSSEHEELGEFPIAHSYGIPSIFNRSHSTKNVYYRRTRRHDIPLITELRILPEKESPQPLGDGWHKVEHPINPRGEKRFLWYKADKTWREMTDAERKNDIVTELDVLFGSDQPWYGFEKTDKATFDGDSKAEAVWLTYRKGIKRECVRFSFAARCQCMHVHPSPATRPSPPLLARRKVQDNANSGPPLFRYRRVL